MKIWLVHWFTKDGAFAHYPGFVPSRLDLQRLLAVTEMDLSSPRPASNFRFLPQFDANIKTENKETISR
jgi:hypothetical protein